MYVDISENWELLIDTELTEVGALHSDQSEDFLLLLLVQVEPEFLQMIHFLILEIGVTELVNVVQLMDHKVMITIGNTSLILLTIKHY